MNYANWAEFVDTIAHERRYEIKVAIDDIMYYNMYYNMYDWCMSYESNGIFYCSIIVDTISDDDQENIFGEFYFSESADAVMFALKWSNLTNV